MTWRSSPGAPHLVLDSNFDPLNSIKAAAGVSRVSIGCAAAYPLSRQTSSHPEEGFLTSFFTKAISSENYQVSSLGFRHDLARDQLGLVTAPLKLRGRRRLDLHSLLLPTGSGYEAPASYSHFLGALRSVVTQTTDHGASGQIGPNRSGRKTSPPA